MFVLWAAIGCGGGGGDNGGPPPGVTVVPGTKKLMTLTPSDVTHVCADLTSYEDHNVSGTAVCKLSGITSALLIATLDPTAADADIQTACNLGVDQCNSMPMGSGSCPLGDPTTCSPTPTVDDLTKCVMDDVATINAVYTALPSCSALTRAWLSANGSSAGMVTTPASCTALAAQCPDIVAMQ
jgi:hypothetical protein